MKPKLLNQVSPTSAANDEIVLFDGDSGYKIKKSSITVTDVQKAVANTAPTEAHMSNENIHLTPTEKTNIIDGVTNSNTHIADTTLHISELDRVTWNNKETPAGAQVKANAVQTNLDAHINNGNAHITVEDRNIWNDKYTRAEIDNKMSGFTTNTFWKPAVSSYSKIATTYPKPEDGWTVVVTDDDITYRYDGVKWIAISANSIPLATSNLDGKMSKEDKYKLDTIQSGANYYVHPSDDKTRHVTDTQISNWDNKASTATATTTYNGLMSTADKIKLNSLSVHPLTHPASIIEEDSTHRFITDTERSVWNAKAQSTVVTTTENGLMSYADKVKLNGIETNANKYTHPTTHPATIIVEDSSHRFITDTERTLWNEKASSAIATVIANGLMSKEDKTKLNTVNEYANKNVQVDWSVTDTGSDAFIKNKPTALPANGGTAEAANKLTTARSISLTGNVTGTATFDGSANVSITTTVQPSAVVSSKLNNYAIATSVGTLSTNDTINTALGKLEKRVYDIEGEIAGALAAVNQLTALLA